MCGPTNKLNFIIIVAKEGGRILRSTYVRLAMLTSPGGASQAAGATYDNFCAMRCARYILCIAREEPIGDAARAEVQRSVKYKFR